MLGGYHYTLKHTPILVLEQIGKKTLIRDGADIHALLIEDVLLIDFCGRCVRLVVMTSKALKISSFTYSLSSALNFHSFNVLYSQVMFCLRK